MFRVTQARPSFTQQEWDKIIAMRAANVSWQEIAKAFSIGWGSLRRRVYSYGIHHFPGPGPDSSPEHGIREHPAIVLGGLQSIPDPIIADWNRFEFASTALPPAIFPEATS